jgi:MFS family permease
LKFGLITELGLKTREGMKKGKNIFYGWWVLVGLYAIGMLGPMARYSLSALSPFIREELLWTKAQVGFAFSIHLWAYSFMVIVAGWMIDRFGARRTVFVGGVVMLITLGMLSRISNLVHFYILFGVILPFCVSLTHFIPTQSIPRKWFEKKAGLVGGIMATAIAVGIGLFSPLFTEFGASIGWRATWLLSAIFFGFVIMLSVLVIRDTPESIGLQPDGIPKNVKAEHGNNNEICEDVWKAKEAVATTPFWLLAAAFALIAFPLQGFLTNIVMWAVDLGKPVESAGIVLTLWSLPSIAAKIFGGWLGDRFGKKKILIIGNLFCVMVMIYGWLGVRSPITLMIFAILVGISYGTTLGLFAPYLGDLFGRFPIGTLLGIVTAGHALVGGLGTLIWAWLSDLSGSYGSSCFLSALCYAMVVAVILLIKPPVHHARIQKSDFPLSRAV